MPARQRTVVAMIDGLDPAYVSDETMPVLGRLAAEGVPLDAAARAAVAGPLTDDPVVGAGLRDMIATYLTGDD